MLDSLGEPTKYWDTLLIHIVTHKLDNKTFREWEEYKGRLDKQSPIKLHSFLEFIRDRADLLETELSRNQGSQSIKSNSKFKTMITVTSGQSQISKQGPIQIKPCPKCGDEHNLSSCSQFLSLSNAQRLEVLPQYKVCFNCFRTGHYANQCKAKGCKVCKRKHHTLIHVAEFKNRTTSNACPPGARDRAVATAPVGTQMHASHGNVTLSALDTTYLQHKGQVILATSLLKIYDDNNCEHLARALLDTGF